MGRSGNHAGSGTRIPVTRGDVSEIRIGVDLDGVACDQISPAVPIALALHDVVLRYEDVTAYMHPIGESHLGRLLWKAMEDEQFVLSMPAHPGANIMFSELSKLGQVVVVTARPPVCEPWTRAWVASQQLVHDEFVLGEQAKKSAAGTDLLIDDYPGNLHEFCEQTGGYGILVERPWNVSTEERGCIDAMIDVGQITVAKSLPDVPKFARGLIQRLRSERGAAEAAA